MATRPMFSSNWFGCFAETVPASNTAIDVEGVVRWAPPSEYRRLLDVGCGIGRVLRHLPAHGYRVTGIDESQAALAAAKDATPDGHFLALDFRHVGNLDLTFDVVISLWNSLGFGSVSDDLESLRGTRKVLRPGGRLLVELFHPDWLAAHELSGVEDDRGAKVDRWLRDGRSCHRFHYANGTIDHIDFNVYRPDEAAKLLREAGFVEEARVVWWRKDLVPSAEYARYQIVATAA